MRIRLPKNTSNLLKQAIAVGLLLALLVGMAGAPIVRIARKDRSRPYPCQNRPCGCASADECWHHCCCMNNRQKLVWARENGVTPPDYVFAAAAREEAEAVADADEDGHRDADDHAIGACACCASRAGHAEEHACCRQRRAHRDVVDAEQARAGEKSQTPDKTATVKFVLSDLARRCGGLPSVISLLCDALPFVDRPQWKPVEAIVEYLVDVPVACASAELAPPVPPPKLAPGGQA